MGSLSGTALGEPKDQRAEGDVSRGAQSTPADALRLALRLARRAIGRRHRGAFFDAEDVAASTLLHLLEHHALLCPGELASGVLRELHRRSERARVDRRLNQHMLALAETCLRADDADPADGIAETGAPSEWIVRQFRDGSRAIVRGNAECEADLDQLLVVLPNGAEIRGVAARQWAHEALLRDRHATERPQQTSNARRAAVALARDALLLSVAGLPWREALDRLKAVGVNVSRDGLRSGLRAARLRCAGKAAHARARS
jgi:hypothetical protein